nr:DUF177 domain-containing protein [uncultured Holophaga sp.]
MIELSKLSAEGLRLEGRAQQLALEEGVALRDAAWQLFLLPSDGDLFLDIQGEGVLECTCSRCLEPFDLSLQFKSQFLGSKDAELVARGSHVLGSQDLDVVYLPETELEEEDLVRDQFQLQVPMNPVCREDCQGLCPKCGKNWNKGRCSCRPDLLREPSALARALSRLKLDLES